MLLALLPDPNASPDSPEGQVFLIVDDNAEMRGYIRRCLRTYGGAKSRFLEASDGLEALACLAREAVTVVITDVVMPRMDGLTLCREIRTNHPGLPVLLVTGEAPADARRLAQSLDAGAALAKPFNASRLRAALDRILS